MTDENTTPTETLSPDDSGIDDAISESVAEVTDEPAAKDTPDGNLEALIRETTEEVEAKKDETAADNSLGEGSARTRDEKGRFIPGAKAPATAGSPDGNNALGAKGSGGEAAAQPTGGEKPAAQPGRKLEPPVRWPVSKKEWFNRQPPEAQEELAKGWGEIESQTTKVWQDLAREKNAHAEVNNILGYYRKEWNLKGITDAQAIAELCATQDNINKNSVAGIARICQLRGVSPQQLHEFMSGNGPTQTSAPVQQAAQNNSLTAADVNRIVNESLQQNGVRQQTNAAVSELNTMKNEVDQSGRYRWPELHSQEYVLGRVQPLAENIRKTHPNLSWTQVTSIAINSLRNVDSQVSGSPSPSSSRLPAKEEIAKVRAASVSVRGRGSASIPTNTSAKPGEKLEDTIRSTLAEFNSRAG